jgi:hypothetical protein
MRKIYLMLCLTVLVLSSCGKKSPKVDTTSIDTAGVEQLELELKNLEAQSNRVNEKIDSINTIVTE